MLVHQAARLPTGTGQDVIDCGTPTNIGSSKITRVKRRQPKGNCNLFLGMIYGNMVGTVQQIGRMTQYTTQLRRDTARCIATEKIVVRHVTLWIADRVVMVVFTEPIDTLSLI